MSVSVDEPFFRHAYGQLVASLTRRVGAQHLALVEDAAQSALVQALETWPRTGSPDDPKAWLYRVALNGLRDAFRRRRGRQQILARHPGALDPPDAVPEAVLRAEFRDDLLRLLFLCCDERIPGDSQLVLALHTLCGFSVREIAERLFTTDANTYKRLARARAKLREDGALPRTLEPATCAARLGRVHAVLYLLFTEGYLSSDAGIAIRRELCDEALRLATLLADHPVGDTPTTAALVALFHLQAARLASRVDASSGLVLLAEQDRTSWDRGHIERGIAWLARSAEGDALSRYHLEAGIAAEHCLSPSLADTHWSRIAERYALLEQIAPSPLHRMNRALAVAEADGPEAGLALLEGASPPTWLVGSFLWSAGMADLCLRAGRIEAGARHRAAAIEGAPSEAVRRALARRLSAPGPR
jgi:RNA polymerase sigma-70 factor (ECF subfamily)